MAGGFEVGEGERGAEFGGYWSGEGVCEAEESQGDIGGFFLFCGFRPGGG